MLRKLILATLTLKRSRISSPLLIVNRTEGVGTKSCTTRQVTRKISVTAFILLVISTSVGQSAMTKEDLSEYGFSILLPADLTYGGELEKLGTSISTSTELQASGAVLVKNTSQRAVVAFGVRFTERSPDGHIGTSDVIDNQPSALLDIGDPRRYDRPSGLIMPGATRLVTPDGVVDLTSTSYTRYRRDTPWTIIKVQVDSVVFDDGQAIGRDQLGVIEGLRAYVDAQQDLMEEIAHRLSQGELLHSVLQQLQSKALPKTKPRSVTQPDSSKIYALVRQQYLDELTATEANAGDEVALGRLQQLRYVTRPNIHSPKGGN